MEVNGEALQLHAVYKSHIFLLQVTRESVSVLQITRESVSGTQVMRAAYQGSFLHAERGN